MGTSDLNEHTLVTAEAPDNQLSCSLPFWSVFDRIWGWPAEPIDLLVLET